MLSQEWSHFQKQSSNLNTNSDFYFVFTCEMQYLKCTHLSCDCSNVFNELYLCNVTHPPGITCFLHAKMVTQLCAMFFFFMLFILFVCQFYQFCLFLVRKGLAATGTKGTITKKPTRMQSCKTELFLLLSSSNGSSNR